MTSVYETAIHNVFKELKDEESLYLLGLSLASNDLVTNLNLLEKYPDSKSFYFFLNSISIIRELAKLVDKVDKSNLVQYFSENTKNLFNSLKSDLLSFNDKSLVRAVLKPIRDLSFHYNFNDHLEKEKLLLVLIKIKEENEIKISFIENEKTPRGQRYTYADSFRTEICSQFLTPEIVSKISNIAVKIVCFVDSLVNDIHCKAQEVH